MGVSGGGASCRPPGEETCRECGSEMLAEEEEGGGSGGGQETGLA